jgi:hypothetical protein
MAIEKTTSINGDTFKDESIRDQIKEINDKITEKKDEIADLQDKKDKLLKGIEFIDFEKEGTLKKLEEEFIGKMLKRTEEKEYFLFDAGKDGKRERIGSEKADETDFFKVRGIFFTRTYVGLTGSHIVIHIPREENKTFRNTSLSLETYDETLFTLRAIYGDPGEQDLRKEFSAEDFTKDAYARYKISSVEELQELLKVMNDRQQQFVDENFVKTESNSKEKP